LPVLDEREAERFPRDRLFLIGNSCAGINFMVAAFGMLMLALLHRVGSGLSAARHRQRARHASARSGLI